MVFSFHFNGFLEFIESIIKTLYFFSDVSEEGTFNLSSSKVTPSSGKSPILYPLEYFNKKKLFLVFKQARRLIGMVFQSLNIA